MAGRLGLRLLEPPLKLPPYTLSLLWHPRMVGDEAHRWLREVVVAAAREVAPETLPGAHTRLGGGGGAAPGRRKRGGARQGR
jgi:hypothetical protein